MKQNKPDGFLALPPQKHGPPVLVLHAWWGLNADIQSFCTRLAEQGFVAFALDLYHGEVAQTITEAESLGSDLDSRYGEALNEVVEAVNWLSETYDAENQGVALVAFSLGVWYALESSNAHPDHIHKVVVFYGTRDGDYSRSQAAYLGHFAEKDPYEPEENISGMVQAMEQAGQPVSIYTYPGTGHWFFEPSQTEAYEPTATKLAWERTLVFLKP